MENNRQPIIPNHYFSYVSSECQLLFDNGHYFGCIVLCQSLAEALARFTYERWTGKQSAKTFGANINKIKSSKPPVQPDVSNLLENIYSGQQRQDFHHLNPTVPTKYEQLRSIATEKIDLLNKVEHQVFEYEIIDGQLKYKYPMYWLKEDDGCNVFLRISP